MTPLIRNATRCAFIVCLFCHASAIVRLSNFRHSFIPFSCPSAFLTFKRFSVDLLQPPLILFFHLHCAYVFRSTSQVIIFYHYLIRFIL